MAAEGLTQSETLPQGDQQQHADLTNCDREPIHIPGKIQPHGLLLALSSAQRISCVSSNLSARLGIKQKDALGKPLGFVFGEQRASDILRAIEEERVDRDPTYLCTLSVGPENSDVYVLAHRYAENLIIELEPAARREGVTFQSLLGRVRNSLGRLESAASVVDLCRIAAQEVQRLTGYGRVMIYKFDPDWHGRVVAEATVPGVESYLGHHFPASDIPRQARELYRLNRIRHIADTDYQPVDLITREPGPIDLSFSVLRSVSPVHIEYLKNMKVRSSMSVSIIRDGKLWGLIACHDSRALFVPYDIRSACEHLGEIVALQLSAKEYTEDSEYRVRLTAVQNRLLGRMTAHQNFVRGLTQEPQDLLGLVGADGAAVLMDGMLETVGQTPAKADILRIVEHLHDTPEKETFFTDSLTQVLPWAERIKDTASGVLAVSVPRFQASYIIWFRPEVIRTVTWAGNPDKAMESNHSGSSNERLSPRKSFEAWKQDVTRRSLPWKRVEQEAASGLRDAVIGIVLKKAEELSRLNNDLQRSNKELEAFSYSVSHDLRAPFRHIVGFSNLLKKREGERLDPTSRRYVDTIADSARYAGALVDSLLAFSQMGRKALTLGRTSLAEMFADVAREVEESEGQGRPIVWTIGKLPDVWADTGMLRLAVRNLLSNAVKYSRQQPQSQITVTTGEEGDEWVISVRDNGVGFDMAYADKLFGVFQRLHRAEEFEGTGIGLANVRRIIERHGGRTWATSQRNEGATFYFTLPKSAPKER